MAAGLVLGGVVGAQASGSNVIQSCVNPQTGVLLIAPSRIVPDPAQCPRDFVPLSWSQVGPVGPQGPAGAAGAAGAAGTPGSTLKTDPIAAGSATCAAGGQALVIENNGVPQPDRPPICNGLPGATGQTGLTGAVGPLGPAGPSGVSGYEVRSTNVDVADGSDATQDLPCSPGKMALSGSVVPLGLAQNPQHAEIVYSGLASSHDWIIKVENSSGTTLHLVFSVVCANAP